MKQQDMDTVTYTIVKGASARPKVPNSVPATDTPSSLGTIVARIRDRRGGQFKLRSRVVLPRDIWKRGAVSLPRKGARDYALAASARTDFEDFKTRLEAFCRLLPERTTDTVREAMEATAALLDALAAQSQPRALYHRHSMLPT